MHIHTHTQALVVKEAEAEMAVQRERERAEKKCDEFVERERERYERRAAEAQERQDRRIADVMEKEREVRDVLLVSITLHKEIYNTHTYTHTQASDVLRLELRAKDDELRILQRTLAAMPVKETGSTNSSDVYLRNNQPGVARVAVLQETHLTRLAFEGSQGAEKGGEDFCVSSVASNALLASHIMTTPTAGSRCLTKHSSSSSPPSTSPAIAPRVLAMKTSSSSSPQGHVRSPPVAENPPTHTSATTGHKLPASCPSTSSSSTTAPGAHSAGGDSSALTEETVMVALRSEKCSFHSIVPLYSNSPLALTFENFLQVALSILTSPNASVSEKREAAHGLGVAAIGIQYSKKSSL